MHIAGSTATAIQAGTTLSNGWTYTSYGPNDRLARFSSYGLTCNNADQHGLYAPGKYLDGPVSERSERQ